MTSRPSSQPSSAGGGRDDCLPSRLREGIEGREGERGAARRYAALVRPGDWLATVAGMMLVVSLFLALWGGAAGTRLIIRSAGKVVAESDLNSNRSFEIQGPLGMTRVMVENRRVRVAQDPGPRQYCVRQGWLSRAGEAALCLPNQVSVELAGATKTYDSLSY